jgi:cell division protein FtsW
VIARLGTFGASCASALALALLCVLQGVSLAHTPQMWTPASIELVLKPGEAIVLGQRELAAPQADRAHLAVRRDARGRWWARNASAAKQVLLQRGAGEQRMGGATLSSGQTMRLGQFALHIEAADDTTVSFTGDGQQWRYNGATLYRNGAAQAPCPNAHLATRIVALWNRAAPRALSMARPMTFGGNVRCDNRLGLAQVAYGSATLARTDRALLLASAYADGERTPLLLAGDAGDIDLAQREEALEDVSALTLGHTRLLLSIAGERATLRPTGHVALFADTMQNLPPQLTWRWQARDLWALPPGTHWTIAAALCLALLCAAALAWQRGSWPFARDTAWPLRYASISTALLAVAGITSLLMQRTGTPPGAGVSAVLGCCALWCCLLLPGRTSLAMSAALLLLGAGLVVQLELGLGAMETSWLRPFQKTVALLAIGLGAGAHVRLRMRQGSGMLSQVRLEWMLAALAACALAALLVQVVFGDEAGVFDLQPVEFAKLALTALTAHCIAVGMGWQRTAAVAAAPGRALRCFRLAAPALLFIALLALALIQVDDFSPLILLIVWSMVMTLAYALASGRRTLAGAVVCAACAGAAGVAYLHVAGAVAVAQWGFYADRFLVWLDPASHPHTGAQLLLGARAIAEGAWWGTDGRLGLSTLGKAAGSVLRVPAVQDDFAASFFLNRHGLAAALLLWMLQALFLVGVLQMAARQFAASEKARDFRQAWLGRLRCFALCGGSAFVLGHFLLSWGTNLAIFPIMGQPMSFLSAGGSHLMFFICPLLVICAISAQSLEENESCRSMFNTKS